MALSAVRRARAVSRGLDQSSRISDVLQVSAGINTELATTERHLTEALLGLKGLAEVAAGDRTGKVRNDARATSQAAAQAVTLKTGNQRTRVLFRLWSNEATDYEIQQGLHMSPSTERPRRGELVDCGLVAATDAVRRHDGTDWTVWRITWRGIMAARSVSNGEVLKVARGISCAGKQMSIVDDAMDTGTLF